MATPLGHTLVGITLARRLGMRSPGALAAATVAASLPDVDVLVGLLLHRDAWKLHRQGTHTPGFVLAAGMLAGCAGIVTAGSADGERDLVTDALSGALIVGSHLMLDHLPLPYASVRPGMPRRTMITRTVRNWALDAAVFGALAYQTGRTTAPEAALA